MYRLCIGYVLWFWEMLYSRRCILEYVYIKKSKKILIVIYYYRNILKIYYLEK